MVTHYGIKDPKVKLKEKRVIDTTKWKPGEFPRYVTRPREKESNSEKKGRQRKRGRKSRKDEVMAFRKTPTSLIMDKTIINSTGKLFGLFRKY